MTNHSLETKEISPSNKRKRIVAAVAQDIVTSEDDDNMSDSMDICGIIENNALQHKESETSRALQALGETIRNTLLEINEVREKNRERRHRELLHVLTKMIQPDHAHSEKTVVVKTELNSTVYCKNKNSDNLTETNAIENVSNQQPRNKIITEVNSKSKISETLRQQESNEIPENTLSDEITNKSTNVPSTHTVTAKNTTRTSPVVVGKEKVDADKSVTAVKQDYKAELQKMRVKMLELQRKKMEDRERKKKEMQQRLQNNY